MKDNMENMTFPNLNVWKEKIRKAGIEDDVGPFDSIISWKTPPRENSGYGQAILTNVLLDGKTVDIYRAALGNNDEEHSVYVHIKE